MARKQYRQSIITNLQMLAEWNDLEDGMSISEWGDADVGEFFRSVAEEVQEDMEEREPSSSVALAFRDAKLQPEIPFNWLYLLRAFSHVHYRRKASDSKKYSDAFKRRLWRRMKDIVDRQPKRSLLAACRQLVQDFPKEYGPDADDANTKSQHRAKNEDKKHADRLRYAISDFGWTPEDFDHSSPPRFGRK